jgi:two-component system cell cycle sensor histidine kinase PleC
MAGEPTSSPPSATDGDTDATLATLNRIAARIRADLAARAAAEARLQPHTRSLSPQSKPPSAAQSTASDNPDNLARLAHEMRTQLGAIATMSEIMRDQHFGPIGDPRYADYAASIHDSARHLLALVDSMLNPSALTGGAPPLTFVDLDLNQLAHATVTGIAPLAAASGHVLATTLVSRLPLVVADAGTLRQILLNLLTNAMKFTPRGGNINVSTNRTSDGGVLLTVADTGRGMTDAELASAISSAPAPTAPHSTPGPSEDTGSRAGLGLGLPLSHTLAAANGARLVIDSIADRGTRVSIAFPAGRIVPV